MLGYSLTPLLVLRLVLVGAIWVLGPVIDKVVEPRFRWSAPEPERPASADFVQARRLYLAFESVATSLFYAITILWLLR